MRPGSRRATSRLLFIAAALAVVVMVLTLPRPAAAAEMRPAAPELSVLRHLATGLDMYLDAEFTASPTVGTAPLDAQFSDLTEGRIESRLWEFGDGATSADQNPTHQYVAPGSYTVSLTVEGSDGSDTETKADYITVRSSGLTADFSATPTTGPAPVTVAFEDLSRGGASSWLWEFGDGSTSTVPNPTHEYDDVGHHTVRLTVANRTDSDTLTKTGYILATFRDVPLSNWATREILACVDAEIVSGYGDCCYRPNWSVDRAQMAVYISRALAGGDGNVPDRIVDPSFNDVGPSHWAYDYIAYAAQRDVVHGYPEGDYRPNEPVTRDQMAAYIARSICDPTGEEGLEDYVPTDPRDFADVPATGYAEDGTEAHWARKYVEYCAENGVVQGYEDGLYHPDWNVTRDQMAVYIARAFGL